MLNGAKIDNSNGLRLDFVKEYFYGKHSAELFY